MKDIMEIIGGIITFVMFIALFALFMFATPDQLSGECDLLKAQMESEVQ